MRCSVLVSISPLLLALGCSDDPHGLQPVSEAAPVATVVPAEPSATENRQPAFVVKPDRPVAPPKSVVEIAASKQPSDTAKLVSWVEDKSLTGSVRYSSLRQLEQADPDQAIRVAVKLTGDADPLVRNNAIGLLARSQDPRARAAIKKLSPRYQKLAAALARRGS